jgi:hydroxyacylglutathione hydrolase
MLDRHREEEPVSTLDIEILPALSDNYVYVIHDRSTGTTGVVDPPEVEPVLAVLEREGWSLDWILITHHHADHTAGVEELKRRSSCRVVGPRAESDRIAGVDLEVAEGDRFELGESVALVFDTPGHTSGHISYWFEAAGALFCADALFSLGCGRLFEGTPAEMWTSLSKLRALPDETRVYCGHEYTLSNARFALTVDPDNAALQQRAAEVEKLAAAGERTIPSTLGEEKAANPFLRPDDPAIRSRLGMPDASDAEVFGEIRRRKDNA